LEEEEGHLVIKMKRMMRDERRRSVRT